MFLIIKCTMLGNERAGKTQVVNVFTKLNEFSNEYKHTVGLDVGFRHVRDDQVKLQIWDVSGSERYWTLSTNYLRDARIILLCCDLTDLKSYHGLNSLLNKARQYAPKAAVIGLVGTKADLVNTRVVSDEDLATFRVENKIDFAMTCSAKNATNIDKVFLTALNFYLKKENIQIPATCPKPSITPAMLRAQYKANGGGFFAMLEIFGIFNNSEASTILHRMSVRALDNDAGASALTLNRLGF